MAHCKVTTEDQSSVIKLVSSTSGLFTIPASILIELADPNSLLLHHMAQACLPQLPDEYKEEEDKEKAIVGAKEVLHKLFTDQRNTFVFNYIPFTRSYGYSQVSHASVCLYHVMYLTKKFESGLVALGQGAVFDAASDDRRRAQQNVGSLPPILLPEDAMAALQLALKTTIGHELAHLGGARVTRLPTPKKFRAKSFVEAKERGDVFEEVHIGGRLGAMFRRGSGVDWQSVCGMYISYAGVKKLITPSALRTLAAGFATLTPAEVEKSTIDFDSPAARHLSRFRDLDAFEYLELTPEAPEEEIEAGPIDESLYDFFDEHDRPVLVD